MPGGKSFVDSLEASNGIIIQGDLATVRPVNTIVRSTTDGALYVQTLAPEGAVYSQLTGGSGSVITSVPVALGANLTTGAQPPAYTTLLTTGALFTKKRADTLIRVQFSCAWLFTGGSTVIAASFRARLDGAAFSATGSGATSNEVTASRIEPGVYFHPGLAGVAAGAHTVTIEWAYFGLAGRTLSISAVGLPDLQYAGLLVEEILP